MPDPLKPIIPKAGGPSLPVQDDPDWKDLERALLRREKKDPTQTKPPAPKIEEERPFPAKVALPPFAVIKDKKALYESIEALPICDIEGGLPITDQYLANVHRVFYTPARLTKADESTGESYDWAHFTTPEDLKNLEKSEPEIRAVFFNPNSDEMLQRILISQNNFPYNVEVSVLEGMIKTKFPGHYELCRSDQKEADGSHRLYVHGGNRLLSNTCEDKNPAFLRPLPTIQLESQEMSQLVVLGNLSTAEYCIADDWSGKLFVTPNFTTVDLLKEKIAKSGLFKPERKKAILDDIEMAVALDRNEEKDRKSVIGLNVGQISLGVGSLVFSGLLYKLFRDMHKEKIDATKFLEDHTEKAKAPNYTQLVGEEEDLRKMSRTTLKPEMKNMVISGPAGSGKGETVRGFFHQVATGQIPHLKGYKLYSFNAENFAGEGAKWVGKFEKGLGALLEKANREPCIIYIEEAQLLAGMGTTEGKPSDILDLLKRHMSAKDSKVIIIFDTNEPEALLKDGAIARRVTHIQKQEANFAKAIKVFEEVSKRFTNGFQLDQEAKEAIVHLAGSLEGGRIAGAIDLLQTLIADSVLDGKESGTFTVDDVKQFFAKEYGLSIETVNVLIEFSPIAEREGGGDATGFLRNLRESFMRGDPQRLTEIMDRAKRAKGSSKGGGGPEGGGTPPPAAPAGGGGGAAPAPDGAGQAGKGGPEGEAKGEPDGTANRVAVEMEGRDSSPRRLAGLRMTKRDSSSELRMTGRFGRAFEKVGGIATVGGALSAVSVLNDTGQLTEQQSRWVHNAMLAGMVAVDGGFLVSLGAGMLPAYVGHQGATKLAKKAGVENPIATNLFGLWGGLAGFEVSEWALSRFRYYNEWRNASAVSTRQLAGHVSNAIGQAGYAIEESLARTWQNISTGLRMYGKEVGAVASGYLATAKAGATALGESLAAGGMMFADVVSCLVTPIFTINGLDTWGNKIPEDVL